MWIYKAIMGTHIRFFGVAAYELITSDGKHIVFWTTTPAARSGTTGSSAWT